MNRGTKVSPFHGGFARPLGEARSSRARRHETGSLFPRTDSGIHVVMHTRTLEVRTHSRDEMIDITDLLQREIAESGVADGVVAVYAPHTTAGVTINENADPDVVHDVLAALDEAVPWRQGFYQHGEGNSAAHAKSSMVGCSTCIPVSGGRMMLGTWQAVYFCEFDRPRTRRVIVTVMGG